MARLPILEYPDPRLRMRAEPVTKFDIELKTLVADGHLVQTRGGRLGLPDKMDLVVGRLQEGEGAVQACVRGGTHRQELEGQAREIGALAQAAELVEGLAARA